jgi:hypothetical protein
MTYLEELLAERIAEVGENAPSVRHLRNQIAAEKTGKSTKELYLSGSVKRKKPSSDSD